MVLVISYNELKLVRKLAKDYAGKIYCIEKIFNPKRISSVKEDDSHFHQVMAHQRKYSKIVVFIGKKSSGSLAIIDLFCEKIEHEKLFFLLCDHDLEEKEQALEKNRIFPHQYLIFRDNKYLEGKRCDEDPILAGIALSFIS